jgi:hypothetical protein
LFRDLFKYLSNLEERGAKPNREAQFVGRFAKAHAAAQGDFKKSGVPVKEGHLSCVFARQHAPCVGDGHKNS